MTVYRAATEVARIAADLIKKTPEHKALADAPIFYVFKPEASKSKGQLVLGKARLISGLNAYLIQSEDSSAGSVFCMEIAENTWKRLSDAQKKALVDHELCHFVVEPSGEDGGLALSLRGHDLEEFAAVVRRHGFWKSDVAAFGSVVADQLTLAIDEAVAFGERLTEEPPEDE